MTDDAALHARLVRAIAEAAIVPRFRMSLLIAPLSPAASPRDLVLAVGASGLIFLAPGYVGSAGYTAPVVAGMGLVALFWGRWYWQRVKQRCLRLIEADAAGVDRLWRLGALEFRHGRGEFAAECHSPTGDWRAFVRRHLLNQL